MRHIISQSLRKGKRKTKRPKAAFSTISPKGRVAVLTPPARHIYVHLARILNGFFFNIFSRGDCRLVPYVVRAAQQGNHTAQHILASAGRELGKLAVAVIQRLYRALEAFARERHTADDIALQVRLVMFCRDTPLGPG